MEAEMMTDKDGRAILASPHAVQGMGERPAAAAKAVVEWLCVRTALDLL